MKCIRQRFLYNKEASDYIQKFFGKYVDLDDVDILDKLKETIKRHLKCGSEFVYDIIKSYRFEYSLLDEPWEGSNIYNELSNEMHLCEQLLEAKKQQKPDDDLPF